MEKRKRVMRADMSNDKRMKSSGNNQKKRQNKF